MATILPTQAPSSPVTFSDDPADGAVIATAPGSSSHFLTWYPRDGRGDVYRDDDRRPMGLALSEHAFEVQAADFFHIAVCPPRPCCGEGNGWLHHYGWTGDGRFADQPERCPVCNPDGRAWSQAVV